MSTSGSSVGDWFCFVDLERKPGTSDIGGACRPLVRGMRCLGCGRCSYGNVVQAAASFSSVKAHIEGMRLARSMHMDCTISVRMCI